MKKIDIAKVKHDAEEMYRKGQYYCSEAVVAAVRNNIAPEMPVELIAAASGFPVGVGRSKCLCGAVSGAVICLGYFFGRTVPSYPQEAKVRKTLELTAELQESFRANHGGKLCCHEHTDGKDIPEKIKICLSFTGEMAAKVAEIVDREFRG